MSQAETKLRTLLATLDPKARDDLRRGLIHDDADPRTCRVERITPRFGTIRPAVLATHLDEGRAPHEGSWEVGADVPRRGGCARLVGENYPRAVASAEGLKAFALALAREGFDESVDQLVEAAQGDAAAISGAALLLTQAGGKAGTPQHVAFTYLGAAFH